MLFKVLLCYALIPYTKPISYAHCFVPIMLLISLNFCILICNNSFEPLHFMTALFQIYVTTHATATRLYTLLTRY